MLNLLVRLSSATIGAALYFAGMAWASSNPIVPNGQLGEFRHGTYPSIGVGDGDWTHVGVDLVAPCGSRVYAFADGNVVDLIDSPEDPNFDSEDGLGYMVLIEHLAAPLGKTFYTLYLHFQESPLVTKDDRVEGGRTVIGRVGTTGAAFGCHTHFEVRYFPERFLPDWGNIYGQGDLRDSELLARNWEDPLPLFDQYPQGLSVRSLEKGAGPSIAQEADVAAEPISEPPQARQVPVTETEAPVALTTQQPAGEGAAPEMEPQRIEKPTVAHALQDKLAPAAEVTSVWGLGTCADAKLMLIRNSLGSIVVSQDQTILIQNRGARLSGDLESQLVSCPDLPGHYYALFGEALALFRASEGIARECEAEDDRRCLATAFGFADVTGDGQLSPAEIARVVRALTFFIGYAIAESQNKKKGGGPVKLDDVVGPVVLASLLSPLFANSLVESYDFDGSGAVSLDELLQDRGQEQFIGAAGSLGSAAVDATIKGIFKSLMGVLPAAGLFGLF